MNRQQSYKGLQEESGKLYLVPTPIGNLEDMTYRAVRILGEADLILAEDTRHTIKLLNHFQLDTPMQSFHEHSKPHRIQEVMADLQNGQVIALVSDAGMPLINDPGHPLVQAALELDIPVIALPGANAALTALVASGLPAVTFTYYGFFPRASKDRQDILATLGEREETAIFYESPYRVSQAVDFIVKVLGEDVQVVIARELTKQYEEYIRGSAGEVTAFLQDHQLKGECVLLVQGGSLIGQESVVVEGSLKEQVEALMEAEGLKPNQAIKRVAHNNQVKRQVVYQAYHELD